MSYSFYSKVGKNTSKLRTTQPSSEPHEIESTRKLNIAFPWRKPLNGVGIHSPSEKHDFQFDKQNPKQGVRKEFSSPRPCILLLHRQSQNFSTKGVQFPYFSCILNSMANGFKVQLPFF